MKEDLLYQKIASSPNPLREIDKLKKDINLEFVEYLNRTSWGFVHKNNIPDAYRVNEWALQIARNLKNSGMEAHVLFNRAQLEKRIGKLDNAEQSFRDALKLYEKFGTVGDILDGTAGLLEILSAKDRRKEIEQISEQSLNQVLAASDQFSGAIKEPLLQICRTLRRQGECRLSRSYLKILLQLGEQLGDRESEVEASGMLAETFLEDDPKEAQRLFLRALELDRLEKNAQMQAIDLGNLGLVSYRLGDLEAAEKYYTECIGIREREHFTSGIEDDLFNFYHVCHYLGKRVQALKLSTQWMELTTGTPTGFRLTPITYHVRLDEFGKKKDGVQLGQP